MTTPIDTTRLRKRAEAVRDAGVKSTYAHHVVKRLVDAGHSDLTSARKDAREAAETLRGAQKRLYRDAPPDGIILALLDEVERLRAIFDDAGQGERNVLALVEHYQKRAMEADERAALAYPRALQAAANTAIDAIAGELDVDAERVADAILDLTEEQIETFDAQVERAHAAAVAPKPERPVVIWHHREDDEELPGGDDVDEAIYNAIHAAAWGMCGELKRPDMLEETITVFGFARIRPTLAAWRYLENAIEDLDEEHGSPDGPFKATPAMVAASEAFARTMESEYVSWACDVVETRVVNVRAWCAAHRPEWLAQLPASDPEEGGTR